MKRLFVITLLTLVALASLLPASTSRAGDVIDFLPEVQTARSLEIFWLAFLGDSDESCIDSPAPSEVPDHILVDINGALRTEEESIQVAIDTLCAVGLVFREASEFDSDIANSDQFFDFLLDVLRGESITFPGGTVLDGAKQSFRMAVAFHFYGLPGFGGPLREALDPEGNSDECELLQQTAINGETLELRYIAMFNLAFEIGIDLMNDAEDGISPTDSVCGEVSTAPLSELKAQAADGNLQAAVDLAGRQFGDILIFVGEEPDESERDALEAQLAELELEILSNTERFPLVALAESTTIFIIELALSFIDGEFGG